jgi:anti-sigma regulatory factor (Ser/Thr protein kinase)
MTGSGFTARLPRDRTAPRRARDLIREHASALDDERLDAASLLISELVTNAVLHGEGPIGLTIDVDGRAARFAVSDQGDGTPAVRDDPGPDGGWGLRLVAQIARRWGVERGHTRVWFEI